MLIDCGRPHYDHGIEPFTSGWINLPFPTCYFRPTPALNQPPELFALGCDIVEECVAEVSKAHAKGVNQTREWSR